MGLTASSIQKSTLRLFAEWLAANTAAGTIFVFISTSLGLWLVAKMLLFGAIFGLGQWLVLRRYYLASWAWLAAPILGALAFVFGALGGAIVSLATPRASVALGAGGAVAGTYLGSVQAALLRPMLRRPVLLVLATCLAGALSAKYWVDALGSAEAPVWGAFGGVVYGLVTGLALVADRGGR
jgi:hypothetical protein